MEKIGLITDFVSR